MTARAAWQVPAGSGLPPLADEGGSREDGPLWRRMRIPGRDQTDHDRAARRGNSWPTHRARARNQRAARVARRNQAAEAEGAAA